MTDYPTDYQSRVTVHDRISMVVARAPGREAPLRCVPWVAARREAAADLRQQSAAASDDARRVGEAVGRAAMIGAPNRYAATR